MERPALAALDIEALARDAGALVRVPSVTGDERAALTLLAELADAAGLAADLHEHDLQSLRLCPSEFGIRGPKCLLGQRFRNVHLILSAITRQSS